MPSATRSCPADLCAGEILRDMLARQLARMERHETGVFNDHDPEELHDYRVAVRRSRALLTGFKHELGAEARMARREFSWLGEMSGPVRDLDLLLGALSGSRRDVGLDALLKGLSSRREEHFLLLCRALSGSRYRRFKRSWQRQTAPGARQLLKKPERTMASLAGPAITRAAVRFRRQALALDRTSPDDAFHRLRKDGKKLRYLLEFFGELFAASAAAELVADLKRLQDALGGLQDLAVQALLLAEVAKEIPEAAGGAAERACQRQDQRERLRREALSAIKPVVRHLSSAGWPPVAGSERSKHGN